MLTDEKKQKLIKMFEENGELWARQEIRGKRLNAEKREFLKSLLEKREMKMIQGERELENEKNDENIRQQKSSNRANWIIAIGTIALVLATIVLAIITYYH